MKKILFLMVVCMAAAFGQDASVVAEVPAVNETLKSFSALAACVGLGIAALGGAVGMGNTAAATIAGTARNPGLGGKLMGTMFIALAMIEAQVIYTLVIALVLLFANPFIAFA
ncbi:MAG: F0F1 ATP synthase subunit C [Campylobacteraceae bacterium]|jgi:F-type H+-transporting ATPase subunit c|nr:F0F1 ATP synthase subunit C [Campylobacteraceae bacterium]